MCKIRCSWVGNNPIYIDYHDNEWGKPVYDDNQLFEMLILEGMQAGLSWITILKKRDEFRKAFDNFDFDKISLYDNNKILELMQNRGIIRNRLKINATVNNAKYFIEVRKKYGSFAKFIWSYVDNKPIINNVTNIDTLPVTSNISDKISNDLKKIGFKFVGSTIIYSFMQAIGMVDDHFINCFCHSKNKG